MTVKEKEYNTLTLEYRQERDDTDYGSCLWARFYFNLDQFELTICSDCGSYGHKWPVSDNEDFLELMFRCSKHYFLGKIYGKADIFSYKLTKSRLYDLHEDPEDIEKLDYIFENIEADYEPNEAGDFIRQFDEYNEGYFADTFEMPEYSYPSDVLKICDIFSEHIKPYIRKILADRKEQ